MVRPELTRAAAVTGLLAASAAATFLAASGCGGRSGGTGPREHVTVASWNPEVDRPAVRTTIEEILGSDVGSCGGATEAGGGFPNHLSGSEGETPGQPIPSEIPATTAFVELDGIRLTSTNRKPWGTGGDGDATTNATDPGSADVANPYMKTIHLEISRHWGTIQLPNGTIRGPFLHPYPQQTVWPKPGTLVDVQGFVRWDALHVSDREHSCSGWEIHPVSAWRLHHAPRG